MCEHQWYGLFRYLLLHCVAAGIGNGRTFLAYHNGEAVGTRQVIIDDRQLAYVCSIGVVNDYRRQGFGSKIIC